MAKLRPNTEMLLKSFTKCTLTNHNSVPTAAFSSYDLKTEFTAAYENGNLGCSKDEHKKIHKTPQIFHIPAKTSPKSLTKSFFKKPSKMFPHALYYIA